MQKFIYFIFIVGLFQTCQWLKVKDVNPEQEIRIIGKIQDAFVKWEDTPEYIRKQVILNLTYNPNDPFKGHAGRINNADQSIKPFLVKDGIELQEELKNLLERGETKSFEALQGLEILNAKEAQDKLNHALAQIEYDRKLLSLSNSAQKIALKESLPCAFGEQGCNAIMQKSCAGQGFTLVDTSSEFYGKCKKSIEPTSINDVDACPDNAQQIINSQKTNELICAEVKNPEPCPFGFKEDGLDCKQFKRCPGDWILIEDGPNIGWCKKNLKK